MEKKDQPTQSAKYERPCPFCGGQLGEADDHNPAYGDVRHQYMEACIVELRMRLDKVVRVAAGEKALHGFYERISYLISTNTSKAWTGRITFIAMAVHDYERATGRPLTPTSLITGRCSLVGCEKEWPHEHKIEGPAERCVGVDYETFIHG